MFYFHTTFLCRLNLGGMRMFSKLNVACRGDFIARHGQVVRLVYTTGNAGIHCPIEISDVTFSRLRASRVPSNNFTMLLAPVCSRG